MTSEQSNQAQTQTASQTPKKKKKLYPLFMKIVRRVHMYTGLLLLPWVIFFGISGLSFSHPTWFNPNQNLAAISASEIRDQTTLQPLDAQTLAQQAVEQFNQNAPEGTRYTLSDAMTPTIQGTFALSAPMEDKATAIVDYSPATGKAYISKQVRITRDTTSADFDDHDVTFDTINPDQLLEQLTPLVEQRVDGLTGPVTNRRSRDLAKLRFITEDDQGKRWHTSIVLERGSVTSRADDDSVIPNLRIAMMRLHKLHDYTTQLSYEWVWVFITDLTAIMLILWGASGAIMWWQLKPTRLLGSLGIAAAIILAFFVFSGTLHELYF